jgi:hypothetical protein
MKFGVRPLDGAFLFLSFHGRRIQSAVKPAHSKWSKLSEFRFYSRH